MVSTGSAISIQGAYDCTNSGDSETSDGDSEPALGGCRNPRILVVMDQFSGSAGYSIEGPDDKRRSIGWFSAEYAGLPTGSHTLYVQVSNTIFAEGQNISDSGVEQQGVVALHYASVHLDPLSFINASVGSPTLAVRWDDTSAVDYAGAGRKEMSADAEWDQTLVRKRRPDQPFLLGLRRYQEGVGRLVHLVSWRRRT